MICVREMMVEDVDAVSRMEAQIFSQRTNPPVQPMQQHALLFNSKGQL